MSEPSRFGQYRGDLRRPKFGACFLCGATREEIVNQPLFVRPIQISEIAQLGMENVICGRCNETIKRQPAAKYLLERIGDLLKAHRLKLWDWGVTITDTNDGGANVAWKTTESPEAKAVLEKADELTWGHSVSDGATDSYGKLVLAVRAWRKSREPKEWFYPGGEDRSEYSHRWPVRKRDSDVDLDTREVLCQTEEQARICADALNRELGRPNA